MKRLFVVLTVLGFTAPALADQAAPVAMSDAQLEMVAGGGDTAPTTAVPNLNINASPIVVIQNATAVTTQLALGNQGNGKGLGKANGKGHGKGLGQGSFSQWATTAAANYAVINYTVKQY